MAEYQQGTTPPTIVLERYRRPYADYAIKEQESGREAIPFEDWATQQHMAAMANEGRMAQDTMSAPQVMPKRSISDDINLLGRILRGGR